MYITNKQVPLSKELEQNHLEFDSQVSEVLKSDSGVMSMMKCTLEPVGVVNLDIYTTRKMIYRNTCPQILYQLRTVSDTKKSISFFISAIKKPRPKIEFWY
jgi:hypothetical protein